MKRFLPESLLAQVMFVLALGLMAGQAISGALLYRASEERREVTVASDLAFRFVTSGALGDPGGDFAMRPSRGEDGEARQPFRRGRRFIERSDVPPAFPGDRQQDGIAQVLETALSHHGLHVHQVKVVTRTARDDPFIQSHPRLLRRIENGRNPSGRVIVAGVQVDDGGPWVIARTAEMQRPRGVLGGIMVQTAVIFIVLLGLMFALMRRITRPLGALTDRVAAFARQPDRAEVLAESGPGDIRRLIAAHNAMETRIAAMLDEKDVMLGAIGHDLKTPLAALRVRIESVPDEAQRARMAGSIEDITRTLDDILNLARVGRAADPAERTDVTALVASLVEEYEDMGEPVTMAHQGKVTASLRATWLKRAVRNLVGNALRYGGSARVDVARDGDMVVIGVDDDGPGIPADQIAAMLEPFRRGEASRNRATGGSGLGLTLARAIAEQHGGSLSLTNRAEGGLRAEIRIPV